MTVLDILSDYLEPATLDDSVVDTLNRALEEGLLIVPVIGEEERLVAIVRLSDLVTDAERGGLLRNSTLQTPIVVSPDLRLYDAVQMVLDNETDLLAVVDREGRYMGVIDLSGLLRSMSRLFRIEEEGAFIEIDVAPRDYAIGRLAHTIEESGARVLSINSKAPTDPEQDIRLTVKVNVADPVRTRAVLEHYGYRVIAIDRARTNSEDIQQRVREFIHYLDV